MKKLLALVLALVMTLSLATVSTNAAFEDAKDIDETYAEAVAVLNGLGVFKGYDEGKTFQPKGDITRAEVAAIVYRVYTKDVKDTYVKNYATYNKFSDMTGAGWAAGYIGYCANAEFVKGYPDGTFKPSGKVTGYEVLAMILRAVGYDKNNEFSGADWQLHVAQVAEQNHVLDNVKGVDLNAAATRELVAELLFAAMTEAKMVTYTPAFGYVTDKFLDEDQETLAGKFGLECEEGYVTADGFGANFDGMILGEAEIAVADQDIFDAGRYGHVWTVNDKAITDVFYDDALLATSYTGATIANLTTKKTGNSDYVASKDDTCVVVYNGNDTKTPVVVKGTEVALYSLDGKTVSSIIVVDPTVDVMAADYMTKNDQVKIQNKIFDEDAVSGYEDLKAGDVFTYVDMADGVRYYEELKAVDGQKSAYTEPKSGDAYITFGGENYEKSALKGTSDDAQLFTKVKSTFDVDATIYTDRGGYVVYTSTGSASVDYAMIIDAYTVLNEKHNGYDYFVNLLLADGTETGYVSAADGLDADAEADFEDLFPAFNGQYGINASKQYYVGQPEATGNYIMLGTLVAYAVDGDEYVIVDVVDEDDELDHDYTKGDASMDFDDAGRKAVTEDSVAFYYWGVPSSTNYYGQTKLGKIDIHYGVNTGKYNADTNETGIPSYAGGDDVALVTSENGKAVAYVVVDGMPMSEYEDYVYLYKYTKETTTAAQADLYTYFGVTSDGTVKEIVSYADPDTFVGTICYYFVKGDGTYDFQFAPYEDKMSSVTLIGSTNTIEVRAEGADSWDDIYHNLSNAYDLTDTSDLKDGDKVDAYDWSWKVEKTVQAMIIFDENGDVDAAFVLNEDVTYGEFTVKYDGEEVDYWYPLADGNGENEDDFALALSDLDKAGFDFAPDAYYHINDGEKIEGDAEFVFEAGKTYEVVDHTDADAITVRAANDAYTLDGDTLTVPYGTELNSALVISNGDSAVYADGKITITKKSDTCECVKTRVIEIEVTEAVYTVTLSEENNVLTATLSADATLDAETVKFVRLNNGVENIVGTTTELDDELTITVDQAGSYKVCVYNADGDLLCESAYLDVQNDGENA